MKLCQYHQQLLDRALRLLGDDCYYSFIDALTVAFIAHYNHHCPRCEKESQND